MKSISELMKSGSVQLSDRRMQPRFRFRGPVEIIAFDVVGAVVPADIVGWTTDLSARGAVVTVQKKASGKGLFLRFAQADDLVMPGKIIRTISEDGGFFTYAIEFCSEFDGDQLVRIFNHETPEPSCRPSELETVIS